ncbi:hypothetical protein MKX03_025847, partial [Papaver bracteatum]
MVLLLLLLGGRAGDSAAVGMWISIGVIGGSFSYGFKLEIRLGFHVYDVDAKYHNIPLKETHKGNTRILSIIHYSISGSSNHGEILVRASMQNKGLLALISKRALNAHVCSSYMVWNLVVVPLPTRLYSAVGKNLSSSIPSPSPSS